MLSRVRPGRRTALFDAVFAGLSLGAGDSGRWLVLVFSDGRDTASWLPARRVLEAARRSSLVVCGVTVSEGSGHESRWFIDSVAEATGGRVAAATSDQALSRLFVDVLNEFRSRYVLTYVPAGVKRGDGWHALEVKLSRARGHGDTSPPGGGINRRSSSPFASRPWRASPAALTRAARQGGFWRRPRDHAVTAGFTRSRAAMRLVV
jgi:hypothetical protein